MSGHRALPAVVGVLATTYALLPLLVGPPAGPGLDALAVAALPVSFEGRVKPLDSVARNALLALSGRQTLRVDGETIPAHRWLIGLMSDKATWEAVPVIRIDHPDVRALLGPTPADKKLFSFAELLPVAQEVSRQAYLAAQVESSKRDLFQKKVSQLYSQLDLHYQLATGITVFPLPPLAGGTEWLSVEGARQLAPYGPGAAAARRFEAVLRSYQAGDEPAFERAVTDHRGALDAAAPADVARARTELAFNDVDPFTRSIVLYVLGLVLTCLGWFGVAPERARVDAEGDARPTWRGRLNSAALALVLVALVLHTVGLGVRIYLMGRPPVTNLYSSAVFIGWGCAVFSLVLERWFRNGLGTLSACLTGFVPLLVAGGLAGDGDTMAMLQAVLDTNFWLATHVITITLGYSATFLAAALAVVYVLRGALTRSLDATTAQALGRMVYGTTCFSILLSFTGTVLGGIWADQSWGRFWGWDPKENGALILVLWNAMTLHGWWGGVYRQRGLMAMAIFGGIVVSWSWFGTNMLGVGLHSYGFMDGAVRALLAFVGSQLLLISVSAVPLRFWRSGGALAPGAAAPTC